MARLLKQSEAQLQTRQSAVEDANTNLQRCTIYSPIDGIVLARLTDKGRTVSASTSAPTLFTIVNDLTKMQISAAVAEADIGSIEVGQDVTFTVDAFSNRSFRGRVTQVRNAAKVNQSVVSYDTIVEVSNDDLKLKPGMTANVSIVVAQRNGTLRVANSTLRVRVPPEVVLKPAASAGDKMADAAKSAAPAMSDADRRRVSTEIMQQVGWTPGGGTPATPEMIEKATKIAKEKGLEIDFSRFANMGQGRTGGGRRGGGTAERAGTIATVTTRTLYKLNASDPNNKMAEPISVKLGITDGLYTEVIEGLAEGDELVSSVTMPGATASLMQAPGGAAANPFQGGSRGVGGMGGGGGGGGGGGRR